MRKTKRYRRGEPYDVAIIACRRSEPPTDPELRALYDQLPPLEPGWMPDVCVGCGHDIMIGRRQLQLIVEAPSVIVLCMECAAAAMAAPPPGTEVTLRHLGGK